jgi:formate hydrogenlyase transcriptional activator
LIGWVTTLIDCLATQN